MNSSSGAYRAVIVVIMPGSKHEKQLNIKIYYLHGVYEYHYEL